MNDSDDFYYQSQTPNLDGPRQYDVEKIKSGTRKAWREADPWKASQDPSRDYVTAILTTKGVEYRTNKEAPHEAVKRLTDSGYLVQRMGDLVRMVCHLSNP